MAPGLAEPQYFAQGCNIGHQCQSAGMYFALGNHEGESGSRGSNVWATTTRKRLFPNPFPDAFFTGNEHCKREVGGPENYYDFEWSDYQFIELAPFRHTQARDRGGSGCTTPLCEAAHQEPCSVQHEAATNCLVCDACEECPNSVICSKEPASTFDVSRRPEIL